MIHLPSWRTNRHRPVWQTSRSRIPVSGPVATVRRRSQSHAFRRDELVTNPQHIPGHRLSNYHLLTGSHSEILSVESKFEGEDGYQPAAAPHRANHSS